MSIKDELIAFLETQSLLTDLLGTGDSFRIFPDFAPGGTKFPYVTYAISGSEPTQHLEGSSALYDESWEFDIWAASNASRGAVADALRNVLDGRISFALASFKVDIRIENEVDKFENPDDASDIGTFNRIVTFDVSYDRPVPTLP